MRVQRIIFFILFTIITAGSIHAQSRIVVQSGESMQAFGHFSQALEAAQPGDIIYLPGGATDIGTAYIEKPITLIGAGHHPQHTTATGVTMLNGTLIMRQADPEIPLENIHLEGFHISGDIRIGSSQTNQNVNQVTIRRCSLEDLRLGASGTSDAEQIHIIENLIRGRVYGYDAQNVLFAKNIIQQQFWNFNGNTLITNNIFLDGTGSSVSTSFRYISNVEFANNVILCRSNTWCFRDMSANTFNHNLWHHDFSMPEGSTGVNNIKDQPIDDIFFNHTGHSFSYEFNYQLNENSPGIGAGNDNTDIGIYGTSKPYKEGAVPHNPQIKSKNIANETNEEGKLQVEIEVQAQEE